MPRRHGPNSYHDSRNDNRRGMGLPIDGPGSEDIYDQQSTYRSREQPSGQDRQEGRYPRDLRDYADPGNAEERAAIRVVGRPRELRGPGEPRHGTELPPTKDDTNTENFRPHESTNLRGSRDPREFEPPANTQNAIEDRRDGPHASYHPDTRRPRSERNDRGLFSPNKEGRDEKNLEDEQEYRRSERSGIRNDMVEQASLHLDRSRDPRLPPAPTRMRTYFLPSEGISPEIIQANLGQYLGQEATFRSQTNPEGVAGYIISTHRPLTQNMISEMMVDSKKLPHEGLRRRGVPGSTSQFHWPDIVAGRDGLESTSRLPSSVLSPHSPGDEGGLGRRPSTTEYANGRNLFDRPETVEYRSHGPSRELRDQPLVRSPELRGSSVSQSSSYHSPERGSQATQRFSRSSYSTAPSFVQGISDDREREPGYGLTQYATRRGSITYQSASNQGTRTADQSYIDPRIGARVTIPAERAARERPASSPAMQPDDDPPSWDETPNF